MLIHQNSINNLHTVALTPTDNNVEKRNLSNKNYELNEYMPKKVMYVGNVRLTFTDWKVKGSTVFELDVKSINNYYPYGMPQDGRSYNANDYRYSFNTQEKTLEIASDGSHTTAEFWEYSGKTGRRWNMDPKPVFGISNYAAFQGNPIKFNDIKGDTIKTTQEGNDIIQEGLTATLGQNNPFGYDAVNGIITVDNSFDISSYNTEQLEVFNNMKSVVEHTTEVTVDIVNHDEPFKQNKDAIPNSLVGRGYGQTLSNYDLDESTTAIIVKIVRNPTDQIKWGKPDREASPAWRRGSNALHEIGGHSYLFLQNIHDPENSLKTEQFENNFRKIYMIPMDNWDRFMSFNWLNPFTPPLPADAKKPLGGEGEKH